MGASVSVMPKIASDKLNYHGLARTGMCLQQADQLVHYPMGIVKNSLMKIRDFFLRPQHGSTHQDSSHLGRPFLSTANAHIDVEAGENRLNINGQKERIALRPKVEQCSHVIVRVS